MADFALGEIEKHIVQSPLSQTTLWTQESKE